jgi:hypothetical protein
MAMRFSALLAGRALPPGRFLVHISVRNCVKCRAIMRLEGLGQLKNQESSLGIETATFWLVAERLNQLRYHVLHFISIHRIRISQASGFCRRHSYFAL